MAGVGKTALAVQWANMIRDYYPDGQLYVDLQGFSLEAPVAPREALIRLLGALGMERTSLHLNLAGLRKIYVKLLSGRRILVVLDNVRDEEQIIPLLPPSSTSMTVITSRKHLGRIDKMGDVRPISLSLLSHEEAKGLVASHLGSSRVKANLRALDDLVELCARLPLALTIVSARAARTPTTPLARIADEIRRSRRGLSSDPQAEPGTESVFLWSYDTLDSRHASTFRLLSLHPAFPFTPAAAAGILGVTIDDATSQLSELSNVYMIIRTASDEYIFHDLIREFSIGLRNTESTAAAVTEARQRMVDYYLQSASSASAMNNPLRARIHIQEPVGKVTAEKFSTYGDAASWLDKNYLLLLEVISVAYAESLDTYAWQIAWAVGDSIDRNTHWQKLVVAMQTAYRAAERSGDVQGQAFTRRWLGRAHLKLGNYAAARADFVHALSLSASIEDWSEQARGHHHLALLEEATQNYEEELRLVKLALPFYQLANDPSGAARGLNAEGWCYTLLGRHAEAVMICERALELLRSLSDRQGEADTLDSLGYAYAKLGEYAKSIDAYNQAIRLYGVVGNFPAEAASLRYLGEVYANSGMTREAKETWRHGLEILSELDLPGEEDLRRRLSTFNSPKSRIFPIRGTGRASAIARFLGR